MLLAIETGGTKTLARLTDDGGHAVAQSRWPTKSPDRAVEAIARFVSDYLPDGQTIDGCGLATFGPVTLTDGAGGSSGLMLNTPKTGWAGSNLRLALERLLGCPCRVDTDVNAAALAELKLGAACGLPSAAYITIGTGIGGGLAFGDDTLKGHVHPEIGHMRLTRAPADCGFMGTCPFHDDCAEGLASGPAIAARLKPGESLADRRDVQALVADYISQLLALVTLAWSPHRIILGGGVGASPDMLSVVRDCFARGPMQLAADKNYLVAPAFAHSGLEGAMLLAANAA